VLTLPKCSIPYCSALCFDFTAGAVHQRNSKNGAKGIYDDLLLLASTDFLVGTFSSQVSRLAFELAQVNGTSTDPSMHYHSVDSLWWV
jgi:hypothetical protein